MKKMTKRMVVILMAMLLIATCVLPVAAEQIQRDLKVGESLNLGYSSTPYASSNPGVVRVECDGDKSYTAVAVGEGTVMLTGGTWAGVAKEHVITETSANTPPVYENILNQIPDIHSEHEQEFNETSGRVNRTHDVMEVILIILAVVLSVLLIGAIVYIFIEAPKSGMSRLWALMPLFSHVIGLVVFIVIRSERKRTGVSANTITCPTCNGVHPYGTTVCSICGTRLG